MSQIDKRLFEPCVDGSVEQILIGEESQPLLKIEGCMKGVDRLREYAIAVNTFTRVDTSYPGVRMPVIDIYPMAIAKFYRESIVDFFSLDFSRVKKIASTFSIVTTPPSELGLLQRIPHFDAPSQNSLAMIHYLCDAPDSGTALYRHRRTGYEFIDAARHEMYTSALHKAYPSADCYPEGYIYDTTPEYERIASFEAVYNRLIMYRGSSLHSGLIGPDYTFDASPKTGRLTITTFIEFHE